MPSMQKKGIPTPNKLKPGHFNGPKTIEEAGLTLIHPFYGEVERFNRLYDHWNGFSQRVKDCLHIVVVDDGGTPPIHTLMGEKRTKYCDLNMSIYRVTKDLSRNTPGALNLGVMVSHTPWALFMDSDCIFGGEEFEKILDLKPRENWIYKFDRERVTTDEVWAENKRYLPCTILVHKELFCDVGGFDEDFTGEYTGGWAFFDTHFDWKVGRAGYWLGRMNWIVATEYMPDEVGPKLQRTEKEEKINRKVCREKQSGKRPNSRHMLRFPWERTFYKRRFVFFDLETGEEWHGS